VKSQNKMHTNVSQLDIQLLMGMHIQFWWEKKTILYE